eukprot:4059109-Amphidinium_carterae.1
MRSVRRDRTCVNRPAYCTCHGESCANARVLHNGALLSRRLPFMIFLSSSDGYMKAATELQGIACFHAVSCLDWPYAQGSLRMGN